nr:zinc carboxypeptidase [Saprospiraceae bacterium]
MKDFPNPTEIMGFEPGEWHPHHLQIEHFLGVLAEKSARVKKVEMGRSHENRPISALIITSPTNHERLEDLRKCHLAQTDPGSYDCVEGAFNPLVLYQAYTSHGNEPSGTGAALLYAWYLAASMEHQIEGILDSTVIVLDACMNPDGYERFVSWVNSRKWIGAEVSDPNDDEFNEPWPRSRTNHYWFDLNRDWLPVQHPESIGKIRMFQSWLPNVLTDHHEMGSNATYFFQPGVPSRTNPMTPEVNQELTEGIAEYHADALDALGVPYYTRERFDDYYYGKGSTYPDIQGCVGILFEQASSRGHVQETLHGKLTFAEAIRNQLATSLSTLQGAWELRGELKGYQREFFLNAVKKSPDLNFDGYLFFEKPDSYRTFQFVKMMLTHDIEVLEGKKDNMSFYYVPLRQPRHHLIRTLFETVDEFPDSLFYDVSTWTMPLAFGIDAVETELLTIENNLTSKLEYRTFEYSGSYEAFEASGVGYVFRWNEFLAPSLLYKLLEKGIKAKVAFSPFSIEINNHTEHFKEGSILVLSGIQNKKKSELFEAINELAAEAGIEIYPLNRGLSASGIDLGSQSFKMLNFPRILMVTGDGVNSYKAGEIWYYFDKHLGIPVTKVSTHRLNRIDLNQYDAIILPSMSGFSGSKSFAEKLREYLGRGKTLILEGSSSQWAGRYNLSKAEYSRLTSGPDSISAYRDISDSYGAFSVGGSILQGRGDLSNPLLFGYEDKIFHIFTRKRWAIKPADNLLSTPLTYLDSPLVSGYLHDTHRAELGNAASILVESSGGGRIIHLSDGVFFRGYWYGTAQIMANAVFFGHMIHGRASE